ncbi:MAG: bis-aminopropyl spermidine synthase family protein [Candidatus Bathyarchaeota archaeon]|nr:bis-aminopropyl spermidine synthase family protein [Candidatus Bathyarchaeota archaeon]
MMTPTDSDRKGRGGDEDLVKTISERMSLKEGEEAVRRVLREVYRSGKIGTKDLARAARLPVPVTAAIRRELEKRGILARKGGATLTEQGEKYVKEHLGITTEGGIAHSAYSGRQAAIPDEYAEVLKKLVDCSTLRPEPLLRLDQAHATSETALRRALYMLEEGDLEGREVLFLGDDDLTSVAAGLLGAARGITVIDIDRRLLGAIEEISNMEKLGIECILHDLREPLEEGLVDRFDVVLIDPPYTLSGLKLFLSRAIDALRPRKTSSIYLAFPDKPPLEMLEAHRAINGMGLYVRELIPRFNVYEGAEILANTTFMAKLTVTEVASPAVTGVFRGALYTGEVRPTVRTYRCRCGEEVRVGSGEVYATVEELKARGCPACGSRKGFRLRRRTVCPKKGSP